MQAITASPGKHLLIDYWGAVRLNDALFIEQAMRQAAKVCGATVLQVNLHQFGDGGGITGAAMLAESHITIHTWPELGFAALDLFMCGACDPQLAVEPLAVLFQPTDVRVTAFDRGVR
ncbi:MAG: adenosylmethionine decarboxylase [Mariprofundus sp.]|nr:adenosylmethionine decarboxylase [Mariprofundus sp.]